MATFRVRATSTQIFTQFYTVEANNELEAIEMVKRGDVQLTFERFEEVDDFAPTHAYEARDNKDLQTPLAPCTAYVVPQPHTHPERPGKERSLARVA